MKRLFIALCVCVAATLARADGLSVPGGGTPGGSTTQVQYNSAGVFGGNSVFTFNSATGALKATKLFLNGEPENDFYLSMLGSNVAVTSWSTNHAGFSGEYYGEPATNADRVLSGFSTQVYLDDVAAGNLRELIGFNATTENYSVGHSVDQKTFDGGWLVYGTGTSTNAIGLYITEQTGQSGIVTNGYGIKIDTPSKNDTSTWTNEWAMYIADHSAVGSTTSYNFYSAGATAKNKVEGIMQVGAAAGLQLQTSSSPASGAACTAGAITWDTGFIYVCTATGVWKRAALTGGY